MQYKLINQKAEEVSASCSLRMNDTGILFLLEDNLETEEKVHVKLLESADFKSIGLCFLKCKAILGCYIYKPCLSFKDSNRQQKEPKYFTHLSVFLASVLTITCWISKSHLFSDFYAIENHIPVNGTCKH